MALSEKLKQMHEKQLAFAQKQFESYKDWIVEEFINKFGGSYQTPTKMKDVWRKSFKYAPECEEFLKFRTRIFIRMLPNEEGISNSPVFLKNFVRLVSDYLSVYIVRKDPELKRNDCANELFERLYQAYAQRVVNKYQKQKNLEWGLQQKAKREERKANKEKAKKKAEEKPIRVTIQDEQIDKLESKRVRERIRLKKQEIARFEISIQAHIK